MVARTAYGSNSLSEINDDWWPKIVDLFEESTAASNLGPR